MKNQLGASLAPLRNFYESQKTKWPPYIIDNSILTHFFTSNVFSDTILLSKGSWNLLCYKRFK